MRLLNENLCMDAATTVTATSQNPNFPVSNLQHAFRSKVYRATGTTTRIVYDMQTIEDVNTAVLMWSKENGTKLSNTATITLQANATNVWSSPALSEVLTVNSDYEVASHFFSSDQSYRYWSILIEDDDNPYGYVELGMCWLGKGLDVEAAQNGFKFGLVDPSVISRTPFGHRYVDEYPLLAQLEFSYAYLEYEAVQILENAFRLNGNKHPVLVCIDETSAVFDKDHFLIYGTFQDDFRENHVNHNLFTPDGIKVLELA